MGCAGNPEIHTPNLDWMAEHGTRLDSFFCTSPVCSPARASLLTGEIPSQHGVMDWIREGNIGPKSIQYLAGHTAYTEYLAADGYVCGLFGKWHLGDSATPQKGFSRWFAHQKGGSPYHDAPMVEDGQLTTVPGYLTDEITNRSIAFVEEFAGGQEPFYLSVHYTAPHAPWINQHPARWLDYYQTCEFTSCPQSDEPHPWRLASTEPTVTKENVREHLIGYFAAVSAMDEGVGRILDAIRRLGILEQTMIVFMGDNGMNCGHHGIWGKGNGTFPANMYDTSLKVPAIFFHPGRIRAGQVSSTLLSGYDFMPTLLDCLGISYESHRQLPGRSFAPILTGNESIESRPVVVLGEYGPTRMIRTDEWKYVHRYPFGPHELYDLRSDPGELTNLFGNDAHAGTITELRHKLHEWFLEYCDPNLDGAKQAVKGKGQVCVPGRQARGFEAFYQDMEIGQYFLG